MSANLIESIYEEKLINIANQQAEKYAQDLLQVDVSSNETDMSKVNIDTYLFASTDAREEFLTLISDTSNHFKTVGKSVPKWKVHANAAKFERLLNEKYGRFRPFITKYPQIETNLRNLQRKYNRGEFSPFRQGPAPIDKKASIILLVIMHRNGAKMETVFLTALFFLVGLQPWALIALVAFGRFLIERRKRTKLGGWLGDEVKSIESYYSEAITLGSNDDDQKDSKIKNDLLLKPVGTPMSQDDFTKKEDEGSETYDTLIIGSGPSTLYTAALLARTGRTVLVLSPDEDASGCISLGTLNQNKNIDAKYTSIPFDVHSNNVAHISASQRILAPALCSLTDSQGGIRFAQIGSESDSFTSDILSIPGMGVDNCKDSVPYLIHAGGRLSMAQDAAAFLGDAWPNEEDVGDSTSAAYLSLCSELNASSKDFYLTKLLSAKVNETRKASPYQEASIRYASGFLDRGLPFNPHVRSLMAGIGMRGENLPPSKTSMAAHVTNINACVSPEGFSYPVGGPRALCHALATVVEQNGGKIVTNVKLKEFIFDEDFNESKENSKQPRCHGVKLDDGRIISVGLHEDSCVVSMLGFIQTFIFKMADEIRTKYGLPVGLQGLTERRPLLKFLLCLEGNSDELSLTGADWYRLPNASLPLDEKNSETGEVIPGFIGIHDDDNGIDDATIEKEGDEGIEARGKKSKHTNSNKKKHSEVDFFSGRSWMKVAFPSAKDPSWRERHDGISTCVITIEAGSNYVHKFDTSPTIYSNVKNVSSNVGILKDKVIKDLIHNFPQLADKIVVGQMIGPIREGLSHDPMRYFAKGIRPQTPYPGLFVGGPDLTIGDSFSAAMVGGWLVSNAVVGYSDLDHIMLDKNITNDITQFMKNRKTDSDREDIAVPFTVT